MRFRFFCALIFVLQSAGAYCQLTEKISTAFRRFTADAQMKHALSSLMVIDAATGKTVYASNEQIGLAPASTLKVVTSSTALDVLGSNFVFRTPFLFTGTVTNGLYKGDIVVKGTGDPTTGSWRYAATKDFAQLGQIANALNEAGIRQWEGSFLLDKGSFGTQAVPGGWTFDDMGNYYGAGPQAFNWHENQYDLVLNPGSSAGQPVRIARTKPIANAIDLANELETGPAGSGDQAIIFADRWPGGTVRGTVPAGVKEFVISGSVTDVAGYWQKSLNQYGAANNLPLFQQAKAVIAQAAVTTTGMKTLTTLESPGLDSIVYFFLQKSINLYGEALLKQVALKAGKDATTENGVKWMRDYWKQKGIDNGAMRIVDGSGLSPHNRVTTITLVQVMKNARLQTWYPAFYEGLPVINGIKMKSGSISGVRGYTGYIKSSAGGEYIFAFLVNNFDGSSSAVMQKMFAVLDVMK